MLGKGRDCTALPCPACARTFPSGASLSMHLGQSQGCIDQHRAALQAGSSTSASKRRKFDPQEAAFHKAQRIRASDQLHDIRENHGVGDAGMGSVKESMRSLLGAAEVELTRRLAPFVTKCSDLSLRSIVRETLDVFNGIETGRRESAFMKGRVPYIEPVEHVLGKVTYKTTDLEGFTFSSKDLTHKAYYIPISSNIERVCQHDEQALEMVHRTQKEWSKKTPPRGTTKRVYADIPSGNLFGDHERLGDAQRGNPEWNGKIRICIVLYYDGLEVANPLGFARGMHQLGVFLYSIVNLDATVRTSPPYIQLAGIALESDVKRYGPAKVFSGVDPISGQPDPELWATPGAQLRLMDHGVPMDLLAEDGTQPCGEDGKPVPTIVHAWALLLVADMLAAHKLGPWGEGSAAYVPCRQCNFDTRQVRAYAPVQFVGDGDSCRWKLHTLSEVERRLEELRSPLLSAEARKHGMQSFGVNTLHHALDRRWIPFFDVARGMLQDDMHMDDDGIFRNLAYQTWNQLFRLWKHQGFTLDAWNQAMDRFNWGDGPIVPPMHQSVLEGVTGGKPTPGAHLRYTASQMRAFILSSRLIAPSLIVDLDEPVWKCWVRYSCTMARLCDATLTQCQNNVFRL